MDRTRGFEAWFLGSDDDWRLEYDIGRRCEMDVAVETLYMWSGRTH